MKNIKTSLLITFMAFNAGHIMINAQQKKASATTQQAMDNNPFLKKSTLQYQAPAFDKIKDSHFKPAF
jgi:peptidyl-dipeptidase Dcp